MSLEDRILEILKNGQPAKADEVVHQVSLADPKASDSDIRAAFFPLVSTHQIEFGPGRTLKLGRLAPAFA
jgi:hypothetical protein